MTGAVSIDGVAAVATSAADEVSTAGVSGTGPSRVDDVFAIDVSGGETSGDSGAVSTVGVVRMLKFLAGQLLVWVV